MSEQLSLLGLGDAPPPTDRLFFALFPKADTAARIARQAQVFCDEHGLKGKPLLTERFHITLHHIGDYSGLPQGKVDAALKAAASVAASPFEVAFDRAMSFRGGRTLPLVMLGKDDGNHELKSFQETLGKAMVRAGLEPDAKSKFTPHVTLLYDNSSVAAQNIATINWTVQEFVLVHSLLRQTRHIPLGRWPLRG
jgi:RNA 2',3'-cyclic 3'-phosphodiesterase